MKKIQNKLAIFGLLVFFTLPHRGVSQDLPIDEISYEVKRVYIPLSISKKTLDNANTLNCINEYYESSWVKEYKTVEIYTTNKGKARKASSENDVLSQEQKDNMKTADFGTDIIVNVDYIPDNNLSFKDVKNFNFSFVVDPETEAKYSHGEDHLKDYLKEKVIDKISEGIFKMYDLAAVKFTISEEGEVVDAHVFQSTKDDNMDKILLETVENMPCWSPAEYSDATKVGQEFVLTVGNMKSCVINLLNVRPERH